LLLWGKRGGKKKRRGGRKKEKRDTKGKRIEMPRDRGDRGFQCSVPKEKKKEKGKKRGERRGGRKKTASLQNLDVLIFS